MKGSAWVWIVWGALLVVFCVAKFTTLLGEQLALISSMLQITSAAAAALFCWAAARAHEEGDELRRPWFFTGIGLLSWAAGQVIFLVYQVARGEDPPYPYFSDIGFLGIVPLTIAGLVALRRALGVRPPSWGWFASLCTLLPAIALGLWINWGGLADASVAGVGITFLYAVLDPILLGFMVLTASVLAASTLGRPWWTVLVGFTCYFIGDQAFSYLNNTEQYSTGHLIDLAWIAGFGFVALGARATQRAMIALR